MIKKDNRGGKREGAGRKTNAFKGKPDPLVTWSGRFDRAALETCREIYGKTLNQKVNSFIKRLAKKRPDSTNPNN